MPRLTTASLSGLQNADLGPGVVLKNVVDLSPAGIDKVMAGNKAFGIKLGGMTSEPTLTVTREIVDLTENYVGLNASLKGAKQVQRVDATIEVEFADLNHELYKMLNPGQNEADWLNSAHASLTIGTGNSQFAVAARNAGVAGNAVSVVVVIPAGAAAVLSVSVTGNAITVNSGTAAAGVGNSTATQVVDAINAHAQATLLAQAGLTATSTGTGVVAAATSAPLAGGTAGSRIGSLFTDQAIFRLTDYAKNLTFVMESPASKVNTIFTLFDCIATEDYEQNPEDANIGGVSQTFMSHASESSFDPVAGVYLPGYVRRALDPVAVVA